MSKCILTTEFDFNDKSHKSFIINAVVGAKWHLDRISTVNDVAYNMVVKSIIDTLSNERSPILWGNAAINSVDSRSVLLEAINTLLTSYQNLGDRSLAKADLNILKNKLETFFPLKRFIPTTSDYEEDIDKEEQLIDEDKPASRMPELVQAPTAETLTASSTDTSDIKLKTILNEVYGENRSAISQLDSIFKRYIFDYLIADRNQGNFIFNRTELNTNIINLKNRLWKTLIEYLKVHDPNFKANTVALNTGYLFSQLGKLNEDYQKVLDLAYAYISTVGHEQVSAEYIKSLTADSPILNGIHAFVMLQKFDALLDLHLDKNVKILPKYMNREVEDRTKYFFSVSSSHKVHGWQEGDERTSIQNTSKLIQFVINSIPLEINGEDTGRNISVNLLSSTITHLMAKAPYIQTTNPLFQELQALLRSRHTSVHKNTVPILKIIYDVTTGPLQDNIEFKNILKKDLGLRDQEIGVLNSLYKYVFAIDESDYDYIKDGNSIKEKRWEDFKYKSLASIELYLLKKGQISRDTYSYSHDIANFINNSMDISYLESEYSSDGKLSVGIRKKAPTRKMAFNFANSVNGLLIGLSQEARQKLMGKYPIEHNKSNLFQASTISLTPNILQSGVRITYTADRNRPLGIFNYVNTSTITIELPEGATKSSLSTLLSDGDRMMKTINDYNAEQTEKFTITQRVAIDLLSFFDDTLGTKFLSLDGINLLNIFKSLYDSNYLEELSLFALKNAVSNQIYKNYSERSDANTSFKQYVLDLDPGFNNIDRIEHSKFFIINNGIYKLRIIPDNISWVSTYAEAQAIQSGKSNPSVTKDFSDNHVPNYVSAFLGGQIDNLQYLNEEAAAQRRQEQAENPILPNLASETLLPFSNQKILKGYVVEADVKTLDGTTKKVVDMTPSEAVYHYIVHNFWSRYIETGEIASQATTYSDKPKLVLYLTDLNAKGLLDGKTKYINYTFKEVVEEFSSSIGMSCKNRLDNVLYHYMRLMGLNELPTVQQVEEFLWDKSERELAILAQKVGIEIHPDLHYRKINDKLRFNSLLTYQAKWASPEAVVPILLEQKRQYINGIISSRANFYVTGHSETLLGVASKDLDLFLSQSKSPIAKIIFKHYKSKDRAKYIQKWVQNDKLILALDENGNPIKYDLLSDKVDMSKITLNPLLETHFNLSTLFDNNYRMVLIGSETNHPDKSKSIRDWDDYLPEELKTFSYKTFVQPIQKANIIETKGSLENLPVGAINGDLISIEQIQEEVKRGNTVYISSKNHNKEQIQALDVKYVNVGKFSVRFLHDLKYENYDAILFTEYGKVETQFKPIIRNLITIMMNVAEVTQVKRAVPVPATMDYIVPNDLRGPNREVKFAVIKDEKASVYNYAGDSRKIDSQDGSAVVYAPHSVLENISLGAQEVGEDKKPLWHHYDNDTGTARLVKYAAFSMTNNRIRQSLGSTSSLYDLVKRCSNIPWTRINSNGELEWTVGEVDLTTTANLALANKRFDIDFSTDVLHDQKLFYKAYNTLGIETYYQITNLQKHPASGLYYISVIPVNNKGEKITGAAPINLLALFDANNNFIPTSIQRYTAMSAEERNSYHTINSLFELWQTLGGCNCMSLGENGLEYSELSNEAVANYMNLVTILKPNADYKDHTQESYLQPLKHLYIGYVGNGSAVKNGAANVNTADVWSSDEALTYMTLKTDFSGVQLDADHIVDDKALMTEFSQVITSLEAGSALHKYARQAYRALAKLATEAAKTEIDAVYEYLHSSNATKGISKSKLYGVVGATIINNIKNKNESNLADDIIIAINKEFNLNISHADDRFKIPFSDNNLYSQILSRLGGVLNAKSVKRAYTGNGMVIAPAYNFIQYFLVNGEQLLFDDVLREAIQHELNILNTLDEEERKHRFVVDLNRNSIVEQRRIVREYLNKLQEEQEEFSNNQEFAPSDVVLMKDNSGKTFSVLLDSPQKYIAFKEGDYKSLGCDFIPTKFYHDITKPRNLAPSKITFEGVIIEDGVERVIKANAFDLDEIRTNMKNPNDPINPKRADKAFAKLKQGKATIGGVEYTVRNLKSIDHEAIISDIYSKKFDSAGKSVAAIKKAGWKGMRKLVTMPTASDSYELMLHSKHKDLLVSFSNPGHASKHLYVEFPQSSLYADIKSNATTIDNYLMSKDNKKLFKVGRYVEQPDIVYDAKTKTFLQGKDVLSDKDSRSLKYFNGKVYRYIQFVRQYKVVLTETVDDQNISREVTKYFIDPIAIKKAFQAKPIPENISEKEKALIEEENQKGYDALLTSIFDEIYLSGNYSDVTINLRLMRKSIPFIASTLRDSKRIDKKAKEHFINPVMSSFEELREANTVKDQKNPYTRYTINFKKQYKSQKQELEDIRAKSRFAAWKQSLKFISARIPGQTLQSFMKVNNIAYTGTKKNICYVSHFQFYLQGSDLDIDKDYTMGQEFTDEGQFISHSDLFQDNTEGLIEASLKLPVPLGAIYSTKGIPFDISERISKFRTRKDLDDNYTPEYIESIAELLIDLYDELERQDSKSFYFTGYTEEDSQLVNEIIEEIKIHEETELPLSLRELAYRNYISGTIKHISSDVANAALSTSPITVDDLQEIGDASPKGKAIKQASALNPITKVLLQIQSMVGKKVIGISAVGEKVYFNALYYSNAALNSGNKQWIKHALFNHTFNRLSGRFQHDRDPNIPLKSTKVTKIANLNLDNITDLSMLGNLFSVVDQLSLVIREQMGLPPTGEIPEESLSEFNSHLVSAIKESEEFKHYDNISDVSLMISQILSASTDNVKELILTKINAGDNLAKCHLHLIMLGFDIKDVVSFMVSPAVSLVDKFSASNIFDQFITTSRLVDAIDVAQGRVDIGNFFLGTNKRLIKDFLNEIRSVLTNAGITINGGDAKSVLSAYIMYNVQNADNPLSPLNKLIGTTNPEGKAVANHLQDYIERVIIDIRQSILEYKNDNTFEEKFNSYMQDLEEFKQVLEGAEETSTLGGTFLGLNQGLPTSKEDLQDLLKKITMAVSKREKAVGIYKNRFKFGSETYYKIQEELQNRHPHLTEDIPLILERAVLGGIATQFDASKWIKNEDVTIERTDSEGNVTVEVLKYRDIVSDYYNIIKDTWSIFHIMEHIPQYNALLNLLTTLYVADEAVSVKSKLINKIQSDLISEEVFLDDKASKIIMGYVNELLLKYTFKNKGLLFHVVPGYTILNSDYSSQKVESDSMIDLSTSVGLASFKMVFETLIADLKKGSGYNGQFHNLSQNEFIRGLRILYDRNETPFLAMDLDMLEISSTPSTQQQFQKYLNAFSELSKYNIGDLSLADWFAVYNLYVHKNMYGSERLTTIFKNRVNNRNSIIHKHFAQIGELDYSDIEEDFLSEIGYDLSDVSMRLAPFVSRYKEDSAKSKYIRTTNTSGEMIVKVKTKEGYKQISNITGLEIDETTPESLEQKHNYDSYQLLPLKNLDTSTMYAEGITSRDINLKLQAFRSLYTKGIIKFTLNCE